MNLLIERLDDTSCYITEGENPTEKKFFLEGIFIQSNIKNRNGRVYPKPVIESVVDRYQQAIKDKRSLGELNHPLVPSTSLDKASHIIESLYFNGDNVCGKARLIDTPMGRIAKTLVKEGVKLGVSTRGVGTVKESVVQNDFNLIAIDIVSEPSGPDCWVNGLMENKEWVYENGLLVEREIDSLKDEVNSIHKYQLSSKEREEKILSLFNKYLHKL